MSGTAAVVAAAAWSLACRDGSLVSFRATCSTAACSVARAQARATAHSATMAQARMAHSSAPPHRAHRAESHPRVIGTASSMASTSRGTQERALRPRGAIRTGHLDPSLRGARPGVRTAPAKAGSFETSAMAPGASVAADLKLDERPCPDVGGDASSVQQSCPRFARSHL